MQLLDKVGHAVLKKGYVVRAPSGSNDWVLIDHEDRKVIITCISKYMHKEEVDLKEWYKVK